MSSFGSTPTIARTLARDLPGITAEELGELALAYEAVARIGLSPSDVAPSVTIRTMPLGKAPAMVQLCVRPQLLATASARLRSMRVIGSSRPTCRWAASGGHREPASGHLSVRVSPCARICPAPRPA